MSLLGHVICKVSIMTVRVIAVSNSRKSYFTAPSDHETQATPTRGTYYMENVFSRIDIVFIKNVLFQFL